MGGGELSGSSEHTFDQFIHYSSDIISIYGVEVCVCGSGERREEKMKQHPSTDGGLAKMRLCENVTSCSNSNKNNNVFKFITIYAGK